MHALCVLTWQEFMGSYHLHRRAEELNMLFIIDHHRHGGQLYSMCIRIINCNIIVVSALRKLSLTSFTGILYALRDNN